MAHYRYKVTGEFKHPALKEDETFFPIGQFDGLNYLYVSDSVTMPAQKAGVVLKKIDDIFADEALLKKLLAADAVKYEMELIEDDIDKQWFLYSIGLISQTTLKATYAEKTSNESDDVRSLLIKDTSQLQREGWQVKADICRLWRIEKLLQEKGILVEGEQRLLSEKEIQAVHVEADERGLQETEQQILELWEEKSGKYAYAVCKIDGVASNAKSAIESVLPEELEQTAKALLEVAAQKKLDLMQALGIPAPQAA